MTAENPELAPRSRLPGNPAGRLTGGRQWPIALAGLGVLVFALAALSGPGRIDIMDGQTRYEVARSLVEHGDSILRDPKLWWSRFPGRDGQDYTYYRFPQSVLGVPAIWLADATGPVSEVRRHFFFVWTSAFAGSVLAVAYASWFRHLGQSPLAACGWALAGVFCTPHWFYATSTFDEILGSAAVVAALVAAYRTRTTWPRGGAILSGLILGLAYNCKQPLGAFLLAAAAFHDQADQPWSVRRLRMLLLAAGVAAGVAVEQGYDLWKFPPGTRAAHAELLSKYIRIWPDHLLPHLATSLTCLAISPGAGIFWYCPPLLLGCCGLAVWRKREPGLVWATLASLAIFAVFMASMVFFKGDPSWGPRYLTPVYSVLWLFAPAGAELLKPRLVKLLLFLGVVVQLLALSVDAHRLYVERELPSAFGSMNPWLYFYPACSHLPNRPREIWDIVTSKETAETFSPSPLPTYAFPILNAPYLPITGEPAIKRYHVLNSLRPWWISQRYLPPEERPVDLDGMAAVLGALAVLGFVLCGWSCRRLTRGSESRPPAV